MKTDIPNQVWAGVQSFGYVGSGWLSIVSDNGLVSFVNTLTKEESTVRGWMAKAGSLRVSMSDFYTGGVMLARNDQCFVDIRIVKLGRSDVDNSLGQEHFASTLPKPVVGGDLGGGRHKFIVTPSPPSLMSHCVKSQSNITSLRMHPTMTTTCSLSDGTVFSGGKQVKLGFEIDDMVWSENGKYVAFKTGANVVVMDSALTSVVTKYTTPPSTSPGTLGWLGSDCVVLWKGNGDVTLVGPYGDECNWKIGVCEGVRSAGIKGLLQEVDGGRWVDEGGGTWWIGRVPEVVEDIYNPGSVSGAACVVNGTSGGDRGVDGNTHKNIMDAMLCVCGGERTRLARAGKGGGKEAWESMKMARVMESAWKRGVYITPKQRGDIVETILLHSPTFAYESARALGEPVGHAVVTIIQLKIEDMMEKGVRGNEFVHRVLELVKGYEGAGGMGEGIRGKIAMWLRGKGMEEEAKAIAKMEPERMYLIPVLLELGMFQLAAQKAGGDTELLGMCLWEAEKKLGREEFCAEVKGWGREGVGLVKKYWREQGRDKDLIGFHLALGNTVKAVNVVVRMGEGNAAKEEEKIKEGLRILGASKGNDFQKQALTDELALQALMREMQQQFKGVDFGKSVISLIEGLITYAGLDPRQGNATTKAINDIAKKFRMSEGRLVRCKAWAFARTGQWGPFRNLQAACPKTMMDSDIFVRAALENDAPKVEVNRYIKGVKDGYKRFKLFVEVGEMNEARKEATTGNRAWLEEIGE